MKLDLKKLKLRDVNEKLQNLDVKKNERDFTIINPEGSHALCAGLNQEMKVLKDMGQQENYTILK